MKAFLSFSIILILFQTLILGSLVRIELPQIYSDKWEETCIDKHIVLDPFLLPGKEGINQNNYFRNDWVPFNYYKNIEVSNNSDQSQVSENCLLSKKTHYYQNIPVYLLNGTLRI